MRGRWSTIPIVLLLTGCAHVAQYKPDYISRQVEGLPSTIQGKALLVTSPAQDDHLYSYNPSSFTGAATTFKVKLGQYLRDIMLDVLARRFEGGSEHAAELPMTSNASIVIRPELLSFDHRYNQLKNLGFLITPETRVELSSSFYDGMGKKLFERTYDSGFRSGGSYVMSFRPPERINHATHTTLVELAVRIANDAGGYLSSGGFNPGD